MRKICAGGTAVKDIYYVNSNNEKIDLLEPPYMLQTGELFGYKWNYESKQRLGGGGKITNIRKDLEERTLTLSIVNYGVENYEEAIDYLHEITDIDVLKKTPGRLYVGGMYLNCYVTASEKSEWEPEAGYIDVSLTLAVEYPMWVGENPYTFHSFGVSSTDNKRYPGRYPYRYANGMNSTYIINPHFTNSNFELIIYGPAVNPMVTIGGVPYLVNVILEEDEYLAIDSRSRTIIKATKNGERENLYHNRQKGRNFFRKIGPGRQSISWTGKFDFDLIIYEERGEPKWK
nr:MAG TPA: tail protein [Caudoviricetes sp.]